MFYEKNSNYNQSENETDITDISGTGLVPTHMQRSLAFQLDFRKSIQQLFLEEISKNFKLCGFKQTTIGINFE